MWISAQLASRTNLPRHCKSFSDGEGFTLTLWVAAQITPSKTMSKLPRWVPVAYSLSIQTKTIEEKAAVHRKIESKNQIKTQWKMSWQQTGWIMWHVSRAKKKHTATNTADISWVGGPSVWSRTGCPSFCYENVTSTSSGRLQMLVWGIRAVLQSAVSLCRVLLLCNLCRFVDSVCDRYGWNKEHLAGEHRFFQESQRQTVAV